MKISFFNLIFVLLHSVHLYDVMTKQSFLQIEQPSPSALFITGQNGKSIISFNIRNALALISLGLINDDFILAVGDSNILQAKKDKSVTLKGTSILLNSINTHGPVLFANIPQWRMVYHDSFVKPAIDWSIDKTTTCNSFQMLGGVCQVSNKEIFKTYKLTSPHTHVKIEAFYHFLGNWDSNTGYLKVDEKFVWTHRCNSLNKPSVKMCPDFEVCKLAAPVTTTLTHSSGGLKLTFGSTLGGNPCDGSYAISDVRIYIK
jgi:hypothetical protein